jgi:hypothetical protein
MTGRWFFFGVSLLVGVAAGCVASYDVEIIRAHEMIQDMESIDLDQPDHPADLPETGILVNNKTDRTLRVILRRREEKSFSVPPGGSGSLALEPGIYHYRICQDAGSDAPKRKAYSIDLKGTRNIPEKCLFTYDVFTEKEVVSEKRFQELRSR